MRKYFLLIMILFSTILLTHATIRTVSNSPSTLAQFNTIQAAVDASSSNIIAGIIVSFFMTLCFKHELNRLLIGHYNL